jgi:polysaccharide biosynthesis transport protein
MESEQHSHRAGVPQPGSASLGSAQSAFSQSASLNLGGRLFQWLPTMNATPSLDSDEGGLNLGQIVMALRRRLPIIAGVTTVVTSAALLKAMTSTPSYQGNFEILTKPVTVEAQVISSVPQSLSSKEDQALPEKGLDQTKLKLLKSPKLLMPIVEGLNSKYPDLTYDQVFTNLKVTPLPNSEILTVSYQDKNKAKVTAILQQVSAAYLSYSLEERLLDVRQGIDFVDKQLPQLQSRVDDFQTKLQVFRQQYNLIDPESASKELAAQTSTVGQQRIDTQIKLNEARALYNDLNQQLQRELASGMESGASSALKDNARYQALMNQILEVESDIAKKTAKFTDESPNLRSLRSQETNLEPLLRREGQRVLSLVGSQIREMEARDRILSTTQADLNQRVKQLSVISRQYVDIQQELKIATENLNQFLTKREALRIDAGQRKTPWQILSPPSDPMPSSADVKKTALLGLILGLLLGVGAAILLDKLSNVLHNADDIKETSKYPILGVIPYNAELELIENQSVLDKLTSISDVMGFVQKMGQQVGQTLNIGPSAGSNTPAQYAASPFLEAFRSLYANIRLLNSDAQVRAIAISSSTPGEGKSTVSMYLAQAAAALGQRVLLVDTDLRLPQVHHRLGLNNTFGLSNLIASQVDFRKVVQQSPVEANLSVLTAGQIPPDPTKLLSSQRMQHLMEQFAALYDLVIYDTPPLLGLADTKLIASQTDGIIMVVGLGKTKSAVLSQAMDSIKVFAVPVVGMVANGSKDHANTPYDTYHRYFSSTQEANEWDAKLLHLQNTVGEGVSALYPTPIQPSQLDQLNRLLSSPETVEPAPSQPKANETPPPQQSQLEQRQRQQQRQLEQQQVEQQQLESGSIELNEQSKRSALNELNQALANLSGLSQQRWGRSRQPYQPSHPIQPLNVTQFEAKSDAKSPLNMQS